MAPFILMRELLKASAVAFPQLSLATQRCFDQRNSASSASAICPSIITMFLLPEVIYCWHKGITQGHKEARSFQKYTCFLSSSRGFSVIFRLWHVLTCTSTRLVNNCRLAPKKQLMLDCRSRCAELFAFPSISLFLDIQELVYYINPGVTPTLLLLFAFTQHTGTQSPSILSVKYINILCSPLLRRISRVTFIRCDAGSQTV